MVPMPVAAQLNNFLSVIQVTCIFKIKKLYTDTVNGVFTLPYAGKFINICWQDCMPAAESNRFIKCRSCPIT